MAIEPTCSCSIIALMLIFNAFELEVELQLQDCLMLQRGMVVARAVTGVSASAAQSLT